MKRGAALLAVLLPCAAAAQQSRPTSIFSPEQRAEIVAILRTALKTDPTILRDAVQALQSDEINRRAAATTNAITASHAQIFDQNDPIAGNPAGTIVLVEFTDVRCPYCRRMLPDMTALLSRHRNLKLIFKDIPILGPPSVLGAKAVLAAARQGGYLQLQAALMAPGVTIDEPTIRNAAQTAGLNVARLITDMADPAIQSRLDANLKLATMLGIDGTPALIIDNHMISGAMDLAQLEQAIHTAH